MTSAQPGEVITIEVSDPEDLKALDTWVKAHTEAKPVG